MGWLHDRYYAKQGLVLFIALYQQVAIGCTFSIISLALPQMSDDFGVDESVIIWVYFMPQLVSGMFSIPLGRAADMYGRKRIWLAGCVCHIISMIFSGCATSPFMLIAARAFTGLGQSLEGPCGNAIAMSVYPKSKRGYIISWSTIVNTLAGSMGIVIGGYLLQFFSWRMLFYTNSPFVAVGIFGAWVVFPNSNTAYVEPDGDAASEEKPLHQSQSPTNGKELQVTKSPKASTQEGRAMALQPTPTHATIGGRGFDDDEEKARDSSDEQEVDLFGDHGHGNRSGDRNGTEKEDGAAGKDDKKTSPPRKFDWVGGLTLCIISGTCLLGFNRAGPWGWTSRPVVIMLTVTFILTPCFVRHQFNMGKEALLPVLFIMDPIIRLTTIMRLLCGAVYMIAFLLLPYYLELALHYTTAQAATMLFIRPLAFSFSSYFIGKKCESMWACAAAAMAGTGIFCLSLLTLAFLLDAHWIFLAIAVVLQGFAAGLFFPCLATAGIGRVEEEDIGVFNGFSMVLGILSWVGGSAIIMSVVETAGGVGDWRAYLFAFRCTLPVVITPFLCSFRLYSLLKALPVKEGGWVKSGEEVDGTESAAKGGKQQMVRMKTETAAAAAAADSVDKRGRLRDARDKLKDKVLSAADKVAGKVRGKRVKTRKQRPARKAFQKLENDDDDDDDDYDYDDYTDGSGGSGGVEAGDWQEQGEAEDLDVNICIADDECADRDTHEGQNQLHHRDNRGLRTLHRATSSSI